MPASDERRPPQWARPRVSDLGSAVICWLGAVVFGWLLFDGFKTGTMTFGASWSARRTAHPVGFWVLAVWNGFVATAGLFMGTMYLLGLG